MLLSLVEAVLIDAGETKSGLQPGRGERTLLILGVAYTLRLQQAIMGTFQGQGMGSVGLDGSSDHMNTGPKPVLFPALSCYPEGQPGPVSVVYK